MNRNLKGGLAALFTLALAGSAAGQSFTIPLVSDFENDTYSTFFEDVADRLAGTLEDGGLTVVSEGEPGDGRVASYVLTADGTVGIFADISTALESAANDAEGRVSGGGIILSRLGGSFYAFMIQDETYLVAAFVNGVITQRLSGSLPEGPEFFRVAARQNGSGAEFFLNGEQIASLSDSGVTGQEAGLMAFGSGRFVFDNFGINSLGEIAE